MKTADISLQFNASRLATLPECGAAVGYAREPREMQLFEAATLNQKVAQGLYNFLRTREETVMEDRKKRAKGFRDEAELCGTLAPLCKNIKKTQEDTVTATQKKIGEIREQIEQKKKAQAELDSKLTVKDAEHHKMLDTINSLLKDKLGKVTKEITEANIKQIHYILSNEPKDDEQIKIVNAIVSILKNVKAVDHVTVNVSLVLS